jgi:hypothetical protein
MAAVASATVAAAAAAIFRVSLRGMGVCNVLMRRDWQAASPTIGGPPGCAGSPAMAGTCADNSRERYCYSLIICPAVSREGRAACMPGIG